ncbi:cupin domain-containing protein [Streptomyces naganishii]|uniref:Cupin n=1 Tax=Streptomyces naganishii JCM 4654 TaxID=1306179 RepID=A0A918Y582_9ACTN|nr:cupin domain-containing protein [Streptomyces naganishii]GHD90641.1 cupin [Streptomyces naganishii JCM 4654]
MPATVIHDLVAELPVPEDGTLSRVLYRDDRLRVVGFAFAEGEELTEHTSALPVVIQVIKGRLELVLGEEKTEARPGTWAHLPARLPHTVRALEPSVMLLTMLPAPRSDEG